ncbi:putative anticodon-binding domain of alanyl-tRNA synthetase [Neoconidiobolus thromboides FSU 785]|nr:putative anticodon-binding domain of alanyl-tRNA synthetase [Neoconidiobolus thromboides FSU 785]
MGKPISSNQRLPCGPCTEIYYDINPSLEWKNEERWLEIWNLVFMRYSMDFNGQLNELKRTCIDTGMGLERLGSVLQGKTNNFDIDSFYNLSVQIDSCIQPELIVNLTSLQIQSFKRIIMDHIRSISLLISEGILPSNIGRGYVLRRLLRRCLRVFKQLKIQGSLNQFVDSIDLPINYYNKFYERKEHIMKVIKDEEENFNKLLEIGVDKLDKYFKMNENNVNKVINKELIFQLYDSYGFPFDLTEAIAIENGYQLDQLGFQQLLKLQKEKSKAQNNNNFNYQFTKEFNFKQIDIDSNFKQTFLGYKYNPNNVYKTEIKYVQDNWLILQPNIFYGYGGGQENDLGKIKLLNETKEFNIINTKKIENDIIMIQIDNNNNNNNKQEILKQGDIVISELNWTYRFGLMIHHSATHLLNYVLKQVLDKNIIQQGSKVSFNKLRFDFNYNSNITEDQICQIEDSINHILLTQTLIKKETIPYEEAIKLGAIATFSEKYPKLVNTIKLYNSFELCSGTHVEKLSDIYPFKISNISTISSGIKRIEAHCGLECIKQLLNKENQVNKFKKLIKVKDFNQVVDKLDKLETENKKLKKENEKLRLEKMKASNDNDIINNNISNKENNTNEIEKQIIEININNEVIQLACFKTNLNLEQKEMIQIIKTLAIDKSIALLIDNQKLLMYKKDMGLKLNVGQYLKDLLKDVGKGGGAHDLAFGKLKENNRVDLSLKEIIEKLFNNK